MTCHVPQITVDAILDTGANVTMIQTEVAKRLKLPVLGVEPVGSVHSISMCKIYWIKLGFWFENTFVNLDDQSVIGGLDAEFGCQCLIGRNILDRGILIYNGKTQSFIFGF